MKSYFNNFLLLLLVLALAIGCSRKRNTFTSRNLHSLSTKYNVLYNGNLALQEGLSSLEQTYQDNYWEILPVERFEVIEELPAPGSKRQKNSSFERAEDKAIKAVQKHSMLIDQEEYNPQIDEAYLLLGKARYYDQRFIPALEAFNYILQFMPESDNLVAAAVWRERVNMRLDNNETAIDNLNRLLAREDLEIEDEDLATLNATLSQAYLNMDEVDQALLYMDKAANLTGNKETEGRYKFIAGQLYAETGQIDSALTYYDHVIEMHRKIPRNYYLNAFIEKVKLLEVDSTNRKSLFVLLDELEENRENRPWLDDIYSRKAILYESMDSINAAQIYYNQSLRSQGPKDRYLLGNNYLALGKISFDQDRYMQAAKYYDSSLSNYTPRSKEHRAVKKKRENIEDVITYELRRRSADSIFKVNAMTESEQATYYQSHIDKLIAAEKELEKQAEIAAANQAQNQAGVQNFNKMRSNNSSRGNQNIAPPQLGPSFKSARSRGSSNFYFYNPQTVAQGIQNFQRKWGRRDLEDNWRRKNRKKVSVEENEQDLVDENIEEEKLKPEYSVTFYTDQLISDPVMLDSIADSRDFAYYQLGVIYKEKFKRNNLAIDRFNQLLTYDPEEKLELPTYYNLYLIYDEWDLNNGSKSLSDEARIKAIQFKNKIITEYPNSRYAEILRNPNSQVVDKDGPEAVYKRLYRDYENNDFETVISEVERYATIFNGDPILPKMELLKAFSSGRLYGVEEYRKNLDYVAMSFPNSDEGKAAQKLSQDSKNLSIPNSFVDDSKLKDFKLLYKFPRGQKAEVDTLKKNIDSVFAESNYSFPVSIDVYNKENSLLIIHDLKSRLSAEGVSDLLKMSEYKIEIPFTTIATDNYEVVQAHKKLDEYLQSK
ncbi:MAG: hypothetical protein WBG46_01450 [Nonlabens sp.]